VSLITLKSVIRSTFSEVELKRKKSKPAPPTRESLPVPPIKVSLPTPPLRRLLALFPVIMLFPAFPVPLMALIPFSFKFSTLGGNVRVMRVGKVSVMVTSPILVSGSIIALTGLERVMIKDSSASLRLS